MPGDPGQDVCQPRLGVDVIHLGCDDKAVHCSGSLTAAVGSAEHPGFSAKSHSPFILPMSAKTWKFIIDGTPILAARSSYDALNSGRLASF
jgi:hypothetical protein